MKKVAGIFAVLVMSIGMFSCQPETNVKETQALYDTLEVDAGDGTVAPSDDREG